MRGVLRHLVDAPVVITVEFSRQEARNLATLEIVLSPDEAESLGTQTQVPPLPRTRRPFCGLGEWGGGHQMCLRNII
jgi:hypothetical protein